MCNFFFTFAQGVYITSTTNTGRDRIAMTISAENSSIYTHGPVSGGAVKQLVIFLHGVGANGRDLIDLARNFEKVLPDAVFVSPDAPHPCDMVPPGYPDSYQWFSLQDKSPGAMLDGVQ